MKDELQSTKDEVQRMEDQNPYAAPQGPLIEEKRHERGRLTFFFAQAAIVLGLSALMLDLGRMLRVTSIAVLIQAILILVSAVRRGSALTKADAFVVKWGLIFVLIATLLVAWALGRL